MGECGDAKYFKAQCGTPEQQMRFVEIIHFPVYQAGIIIKLQHMQRDIGMVSRILINEGKSKTAHINHQDKETNNPRGEIFPFELYGGQLIHGNLG